jgi:transaldolase
MRQSVYRIDPRTIEMSSKLDQLRQITTVVADTGDVEAIRQWRPVDCTTNPTLILKAVEAGSAPQVVEDALAWGRRQPSGPATVAEVSDRLAIGLGAELTRLVPGRVSTEVDADLSFDAAAMVAKARAIIAAYAERGIGRERILIKLASTWEGIEACRTLQAEGIDCNMTLMFSLAQAAAAAESNAFLISPFVGRILDWHVKAGGGPYTGESDPGVLSVRRIFAYYKRRGAKTVVMGASFRNLGEIEALAGCDRLTIAPALLETLSKDTGALPRRLDPANPGEDPGALVPGKIGLLDEAEFRFLLNEDAMATEKLAEGIRLFAKDLRALRGLVAARLGKAA